MVVPSPLVTAEAQLQILERKNCTLYLRPEEMAVPVAGVLKGTSHIHTITVPALDQFLNETEARQVNYPKSWVEGKDDPWLVFHTSGTTGMTYRDSYHKWQVTLRQETLNPSHIRTR
jgi:acyl-coenzyme A synthetase/AMP-(fatty) acid ligase